MKYGCNGQSAFSYNRWRKGSVFYIVLEVEASLGVSSSWGSLGPPRPCSPLINPESEKNKINYNAYIICFENTSYAYIILYSINIFSIIYAPRSSKEFHGTARGSQDLPGAPRSFQGLPGAPGRSQELPGAPRSPLEQPGVPRSSQDLSGAPRSSQELPGSPRSSRKHPGAPRSYQELPGAPAYLNVWNMISYVICHVPY